MHLLSIDTSTKNFSLAVSSDGKILKYRNIILHKILSDSITTSIRGVLKESRLDLRQLDGFAVGLGPGSFTSLRVGLSTIKALAFATRKPVVGISSLDILAADPKLEGNICILCDARRNLVYSAFYEKKNGRLKRKGKYLLASIEEVIKRAASQTTFAGDALGLYKEVVNKRRGRDSNPTLMPAFPQAKNLVPLALERFQKKRVDDVSTLVPLYLYPQDCQVRR